MPVSEMVPNIPDSFLPFTLEVHRFPLLGSVGQATYHRLRSGSPSSRRRPSGPPPCPLPPFTPGVEPLLFSAGGNISGSRATGGVGAAGVLRACLCQNQEVSPSLPGRSKTSRRPLPPGLLTSPSNLSGMQSSCPHSHGPVRGYLSSLSLTQIPETSSHLPDRSYPAPYVNVRVTAHTGAHTRQHVYTQYAHICLHIPTHQGFPSPELSVPTPQEMGLHPCFHNEHLMSTVT